LGESGSVAWIFERKGFISFDKEKVDEEKLMSVAIEAGAEDLKDGESTVDVITPPSDFDQVKEAIENAGLSYDLAQITMLPKTMVNVEGKTAQQVLDLIDALEEHDDVQEVYSNFEVADEVLESLDR
jgi:transcriptional/translational regulatory protein YebC/TACO1